MEVAGENEVHEANCDEARCSSCMNLIEEEEFLCALGQDWHTDCFCCSVCDEALSSWYFEKDGLLFCKTDYWKNYGEACQQCSEIITGPVMVAGEHKFHPECFTCNSCNVYIGDGESYALVERSKLYCGACYKRQMQPSNKGSPCSRKPHSIQLIELPPKSEGQRTIKLSIDSGKTIPLAGINNFRSLRIAELDSAADLASLHIGDRILEVNGRPVQDHCIEELETLISNSNFALQLTIEHDPNEALARRQSFPFSNHLRDQIEKNKRQDLREQLFKKKDEGYLSSSQRSRQLRRGRGCKERSSSLPKLLENDSPRDCEFYDLSRTHSFRKEPKNPRIFRASDLSQGEFLGKGFFGHVYKVKDIKSGEVMVLKELYRVDEKAQKNFLKEVAVLRSLSHRNVLGFIGVLYKDKRLHLVTEYISGGTLKELINDLEEDDLPWHQRINFGKDIASGMTYLHGRDIIHRDLNSHNCLVREDKTVVVADFGLARILPQNNWTAERKKFGKRHARKKRYTVVGNPYWMAPEMMKGNKYDEKVDLFSFGIILCEVIGRVEADPDYMPRSFDFGLNETVFESKYCRECPPPFYKIAFLCCNTNPDRRPPFETLEVWLETLAMYYSIGTAIPHDILNDIYSYNGPSPSSSEPSTPEILTPDPIPLQLLRTISEGISFSASNNSFDLALHDCIDGVSKNGIDPSNSLITLNDSQHLSIANTEESLKDAISDGSCSKLEFISSTPKKGSFSPEQPTLLITPLEADGEEGLNNNVKEEPCTNDTIHETDSRREMCSSIDIPNIIPLVKLSHLDVVRQECKNIPESFSPITKRRTKSPLLIEDSVLRLSNCSIHSIDDKRQSSLLESTHL